MAVCSCNCDGEGRCGRPASNYCDACLDSLCGACYSVVQIGSREHVTDYCGACFERSSVWAARESVSFQVLGHAPHVRQTVGGAV